MEQNSQATSEVSPMTLEEFKKTLGENATKYSEEQIDHMRIVFFKLANILFDDWLSSRDGI